MNQAYDCAPTFGYHTELSCHVSVREQATAPAPDHPADESLPMRELEQHWDVRSVRRFSALAADTTAATDFDLGTLWLDACAGRLRIVDTFFSSERCYAITERLPAGARNRPFSQRRLRILERVLLGTRAKVVAMELDLSPSAIAGALSYCLTNLGFAERPNGLPLLLVMAARAARAGMPFEARISRLGPEQDAMEIVSAARPDLKLAEHLSQAELAVTWQLLEGCDHDEIARARGTSPRTVANQLGAAYRKLGVSGRAELIHQVMSL